MNKTINGKRYDTEKAKPVGEAGNGLYPGDLDYYCETLYLKRTGEFFLHMEGGPRSGCAKADGTGWVGGEELRPVSFEVRVRGPKRTSRRTSTQSSSASLTRMGRPSWQRSPSPQPRRRSWSARRRARARRNRPSWKS